VNAEQIWLQYVLNVAQHRHVRETTYAIRNVLSMGLNRLQHTCRGTFGTQLHLGDGSRRHASFHNQKLSGTASSASLRLHFTVRMDEELFKIRKQKSNTNK
jgi:hypothetical protein